MSKEAIKAIVKGIMNRDKTWSIIICLDRKTYGICGGRFLSEKGIDQLRKRLEKAHTFLVVSDAEVMKHIMEIPKIAKEGIICSHELISPLVKVLKKPSLD